MSSCVVLLHAYVLLQCKARLGSLWLKYHLGSEVTEKEEPEKAVSSAHGESGQPPQAWDPCWVPLAASRGSVTFCRGLRIIRIKTANFLSLCSGACNFRAGGAPSVVPRVGYAVAKRRPGEVSVVLQ